MKKILWVAIFGSLTLASCAKKEEPKTTTQQQPAITQAEEPRTGTMMMAEAKEKLSEAKDKLIQEGKISCCLKEPCNMCPLGENECECYKDLKKGEHVCVECYAGWQQGKGGIEGIKKEDVKTSFVKHEHEH